MNNEQRIATIRKVLQQKLEPTQLEIIDDSHLHAGHAGAKTGKGHFTVKIRSAKFKHHSRIEQHRMVYAALESLFETDIHALKIQSSTD